MKSEAQKAASRRWNQNNRERLDETRNRWRMANADRVKERRKMWLEKNRDRANAARRAWRKANREKERAASQRYRVKYPEKVRQRMAKANLVRMDYSLTPEQYQAILVGQGGGCAICGAESGNSKGHRLFIDHDHVTGALRGLLCNRCNSSLGYMRDSPSMLRRAADYLERQRPCLTLGK